MPHPLGEEVMRSQLTGSVTRAPCVPGFLDSALNEQPLGSATKQWQPSIRTLSGFPQGARDNGRGAITGG